jgi:hypothetical protein
MKNAMILKKIEGYTSTIIKFTMVAYPSDDLKDRYFTAVLKLKRLRVKYPRFTSNVREAMKGNY